MKNQTQIEVIEFLEDLVGRRFSMETLNKAINNFFGQEVELENVSFENDEDDELPDFNIMFNIEDGTDKSGYYDIYMLPMRRKGFDGSDMYITEVGYEFS